MTVMTPLAAAIDQASGSFSGELVQPDDAGYDVWRRVHNGLIDKRPAAIARCQGVADVVDAVRLARARGLDVAVRGGGHNVAGHGTLDRGLLIDLSPMKGIHVDPRTRTVRAQGGVLWKELNRETQVHSLATTGGVVGSTGIAGLTLGGGIGWLMPKYGLALDNLRAVDLVTAEGQVLHASGDENADLFWALRGGGGNFGIATSLEYRPPCDRPADHRGRCRTSAGARAGRAQVLPRDVRGPARGDDADCGAPDRTRWIECETRRRTGGALRIACRRCSCGSAAQGIRAAGDGCARSNLGTVRSTTCSTPRFRRGRSTTGRRSS